MVRTVLQRGQWVGHRAMNAWKADMGSARLLEEGSKRRSCWRTVWMDTVVEDRVDGHTLGGPCGWTESWRTAWMDTVSDRVDGQSRRTVWMDTVSYDWIL